VKWNWNKTETKLKQICFSICIFLHVVIVVLMSLKQLWNKYKTFQIYFSVLFQLCFTCAGIWNKTETIFLFQFYFSFSFICVSSLRWCTSFVVTRSAAAQSNNEVESCEPVSDMDINGIVNERCTCMYACGFFDVLGWIKVNWNYTFLLLIVMETLLKYVICVSDCTMCLAVSELFILRQSFVSFTIMIVNYCLISCCLPDICRIIHWFALLDIWTQLCCLSVIY